MNTTMFWSCTGIDASELSFGTAKTLSENERTLIAELPCLGIPRLGFVCSIMDRERNTEAAMTYFEQAGKLRWEMVHPVGRRLFVLPASVFAVPDYPVVTKVSIETIMGFVPALRDLAQSNDCTRLVLECQGQLNSPTAFFSLQAAGQVVIPLGKPTEAAYALASVRRLVQLYRQRPEKFILAAAGNVKAVESAATAWSKDDDMLEGLRITAWDCRKVKNALSAGEPTRGKGVVLPIINHQRRRDAGAREDISWATLLSRESGADDEKENPWAEEDRLAERKYVESRYTEGMSPKNRLAENVGKQDGLSVYL